MSAPCIIKIIHLLKHSNITLDTIYIYFFPGKDHLMPERKHSQTNREVKQT